jgi:hypothetical protein
MREHGHLAPDTSSTRLSRLRKRLHDLVQRRTKTIRSSVASGVR